MENHFLARLKDTEKKTGFYSSSRRKTECINSLSPSEILLKMLWLFEIHFYYSVREYFCHHLACIHSNIRNPQLEGPETPQFDERHSFPKILLRGFKTKISLETEAVSSQYVCVNSPSSKNFDTCQTCPDHISLQYSQHIIQSLQKFLMAVAGQKIPNSA